MGIRCQDVVATCVALYRYWNTVPIKGRDLATTSRTLCLYYSIILIERTMLILIMLSGVKNLNLGVLKPTSETRIMNVLTIGVLCRSSFFPCRCSLAAAYCVHDSKMLDTAVDAIPPIRGRRWPPRRRPSKLHADKAFDFHVCRRALRKRHIQLRVARRGIDSSGRLGHHRWGVEGTPAWLSRFRRLRFATNVERISTWRF